MAGFAAQAGRTVRPFPPDRVYARSPAKSCVPERTRRVNPSAGRTPARPLAMVAPPRFLCSPVARDTCFYDGHCGFCRRSARILHALDWLQRLEFVDQSTRADHDLPVPRDAALKGMPLLTPTGRVLIGFPAIRRTLRQTPLGFLPALLLFIPGLSQVGRAVYERIAANRRRDACAVPPPGA